MPQEPARRRALITGASSGIGAAFAQRLARDGYDLMVVARRGDRLQELARQLATHGVAVEPVAADLSDAAGLAAVESRAIGSDLDLLVNNAGSGVYMPFIQLPPDHAEALIRLQVVAVARLTRAVLPAMVKRKSGAVINVASLLAFSAPLPTPPLPFRATYAATKAFIVTMTELLAAELANTAVKIQALCPSVVRTEFHAAMGIDNTRFPMPLMEAAEVVDASLKGLELGETICVPPLPDPAYLQNLRTAQRELLESCASNTVAARYQ